MRIHTCNRCLLCTNLIISEHLYEIVGGRIFLLILNRSNARICLRILVILIFLLSLLRIVYCLIEAWNRLSLFFILNQIALVPTLNLVAANIASLLIRLKLIFIFAWALAWIFQKLIVSQHFNKVLQVILFKCYLHFAILIEGNDFIQKCRILFELCLLEA